MPHAVVDESTAEIAGDDDAIRRFLQGNNDLGGLEGTDAFDRDFDQSGKDADAVDYEDISDDDDLPEEEEATNHIDDNDGRAFFNHVEGELTTLGVPDQANGHHSPTEPANNDMLDGDDVNDLFGEQQASPELGRGHSTAQAPHLALPTKSTLALPTLSTGSQQLRSVNGNASVAREFNGHHSPASDAGSDEVMGHDGEDDDNDGDSDEDEAVRAQRALFRAAKRQRAGLNTVDEDVELDLARFYTFFPGYERHQNPRFIELFPHRMVQFRGKVPLKPPKALQATKVSLDLLPDQERAFRTSGNTNNVTLEPRKSTLVYVGAEGAGNDASDDEFGADAWDETETVGGLSMQDLALICEDWEVDADDSAATNQDVSHEGSWELEESKRPSKKLRTDLYGAVGARYGGVEEYSLENPEAATAKIAKRVALDLNDPNLLIDEHPPPTKRAIARASGNFSRDTALKKDLIKRYNISNDEAYDLLKENHQHKIRSTLGSMAVEHSMPAIKLQYPFYKVGLDAKTKRNFHRPGLHSLEYRRDYRFSRPKTVKRKERRGREIKDLFSTAESLAHNDNANMILLEYSEEAPILMSNFGMGNRLINYYRKRNADDQERPKREIGETQVLLTQDKSPFANFGHVDQGEIVPTLQNAMYRAPIFQHAPKAHDFFISISHTHSGGNRMYLRQMENLHTVGQQFPLVEVPGEHSRKVTDAAKKRLRALSYRIYTKSQDPKRNDKQLDNATIMQHLKGHDMPQTRSKMREFMEYQRLPHRDGGVWVPKGGQAAPDNETLRGWVKPEDICLLDSMQVGVQRLNDLGLSTGKEADDDKDDDGGNIESQLAPWRTTKNFLNATQGKAMLKLHGEGDPTGRGEGFSFVRTSMKGGFQALGESAEDKIDAKKRREAGGHSYNVAKQQKAYDDYIRMIWDRQKQSLANNMEMSDDEMDDEPETDVETPHPYGRAATPRSSIGPGASFSRRDDESASQFSKTSAGRNGNALVIKRVTKDFTGQQNVRMEHITDPKVIALYKRRRLEKRVNELKTDINDIKPTGDPLLDAYNKEQLEKEVARIARNIDRRHAREKAKGKGHGSPAFSGSPGLLDDNAAGDGATPTGPQKGRGRNKDATARKCANCGQVGHIKTNRKSVYICNPCRKAKKLRGLESGESTGASEVTPRTTGASSFLSETYSAFQL